MDAAVVVNLDHRMVQDEVPSIVAGGVPAGAEAAGMVPAVDRGRRMGLNDVPPAVAGADAGAGDVVGAAVDGAGAPAAQAMRGRHNGEDRVPGAVQAGMESLSVQGKYPRFFHFASRSNLPMIACRSIQCFRTPTRSRWRRTRESRDSSRSRTTE